MDFKHHLEVAWHQTLNHLVSLIVLTLVMVVVSFTVILVPVMMAGYVQAIMRMIRENREPQIQDLFSCMNLFLPLIAFSAAAAILIALGWALFVLPGFILSCLLAFACFYVIPLMTDRQMGLIDAVKTSWLMAFDEKLMDHVAVVILFLAMVTIGGSFFFGILFTQPFATIFMLSVYLEKTGNLQPLSNVEPPPTAKP